MPATTNQFSRPSSDTRGRPRPAARNLTLLGTMALLASAAGAAAQTGSYTLTNLGKPPGAHSAIGVRMNNLGHVAGWSQYFGQGEPSLKPWVWTPEAGFTVLPPPPGMFLGRARAMDISDTGIVAGDGGFDIGLAWRYENGTYTITGGAGGMPIAYLGGVNNAGDIAGTAKDSQLITPDVPWLDVNGGALVELTPGSGGRATDVNINQQVSGYTQGPASAFQAFRWDPKGGIQLLGALGLAHSFANAINDAGQVVGEALSATGNTSKAWVYTDGVGMQQIPAPVTQHTAATGINIHGDVVGTADVGGPDLAWLWSPEVGFFDLNALFDAAGENVNALGASDINDAGQILARVFDNNAVEFRTVILTPPVIVVPGDLNGDGVVDVGDLLILLAAWGPCPGGCQGPCPADLDGDCTVAVGDLLLLLADWG